ARVSPGDASVSITPVPPSPDSVPRRQPNSSTHAQNRNLARIAVSQGSGSACNENPYFPGSAISSPLTMNDSAKIGRQTTIAAVIVIAGVALAAVATFRLGRPRLEPIEVSQQTTYIITPTRADGWVDYPEAVDWMRRASLDAGGANATGSLLRSLGRAALPAGSDRGALLERLKITDAGDDASVLKPLA